MPALARLATEKQTVELPASIIIPRNLNPQRNYMTNSVIATASRHPTMSSVELLEFVNQARVEFGEKPVRHNDFLARCKDELENEPYEKFVESARAHTPLIEE